MNLDNLKIKSLVFDKDGDDTIIGKDIDNIVAYEDKENILIKIGGLLDGQHTLSEIRTELSKEKIFLEESNLVAILKNVFLDNDLILKNNKNFILSEREIIKYDRLIHFFASYNGVDFLKAQEMQKKLFNSNILVLGVGGTGGHTAHALIASGVGNMTLLDFDKIELTNVTRQMLYHEKDIGLDKVEVARERLQLINPNTNINIINKEITSSDEIKEIVEGNDFDFVINTMDNPRGEIRYILDEALYDSGVPYIYDGSSGHNASVGPTIHKGETKKYSDLVPNNVDRNEEIQSVNDEIYITNVIEPLNGAVGQFTAFEVIKYLTKCAPVPTMGARINLDMDLLEIKKYEL